MTTLMSGDGMPMGRVLPKVFADVPSAEELKQAHETARRARARAGGLTLLAVLLAGALVAAIIFIFVTANSSPAGDLIIERDNALKEVTRLKAEETRLTGEVAKERAATQAANNMYSDYTRIANAEKNIADRRGEITKLIEQAPTASETTVRNVAGWAAYRRTTKWPAIQGAGDWKSYVAENLEAQLVSLDGLKSGIDAFIRRPVNNGGGGSACTPSTPGYPVC
jgi:hypothetical protein